MEMDDKTKALIDSIITKRNQVSADLKAEPKYYLSHNKECTEFRGRVMADVDQFTRGYMFGTACICHGAEDRILDRVEITITRYYSKGPRGVVTEQRGSIRDINDLAKLESLVTKRDKVDPHKFSGFMDEVIIELNHS